MSTFVRSFTASKRSFRKSSAARAALSIRTGPGMPRYIYAEAVEEMNVAEGFKLALDVPSGICSDTGRVLGCAFLADATITFVSIHLRALSQKALRSDPHICNVYLPGIIGSRIHYKASLAETKSNRCICQESIREPIMPGRYTLQMWGSDRRAFWDRARRCILMTDVKQHLPDRTSSGNKGTFGKALLVAGSNGMAGAAILAARAAYRTGAGMVSKALPKVPLFPEDVLSGRCCSQLS